MQCSIAYNIGGVECEVRCGGTINWFLKVTQIVCILCTKMAALCDLMVGNSNNLF